MSDNDNYITRREYDERHTAIQLQISKLTGVLDSNQHQLSTLIEKVDQLQVDISKVEKQIAVEATYNKILWPAITLLVAVIGILVGTRI